MKRFAVALALCILITGCGAPPSGTAEDKPGPNQVLAIKGAVPWKCINSQGETVYNDSTLSLHPSQLVQVQSVELLDPFGVKLDAAYIFPFAMGPGIRHPGLGRGWPGDPLTPQQAAQRWDTAMLAAGQALPAATPTRGFSLALKVQPTETQWEYKGVVISFTSGDQAYTKRVWAGTRGAKNCAEFPADIQGDRTRYGS